MNTARASGSAVRQSRTLSDALRMANAPLADDCGPRKPTDELRAPETLEFTGHSHAVQYFGHQHRTFGGH